MNIKKILLLSSCFFMSMYSEIRFQFFPLSKTKTELLKQMIIDEDIFINGNLSTGGIITSLTGIKINDGISKISGEIFLNPYSRNNTNIGNSNNGGNISILTAQNNQCILQSGSIVIKSPYITVPDINNTLPLTVDSQGVIRTLYSTKKMKENINPLHFSAEDINNLQVYSFNYREESGLPQGEEWGFIAEELVGTCLDNCVIKNSENNIININERKLFAFSVAIIKELLKKIEALEERINDIELIV